jgi:hypothetical protein
VFGRDILLQDHLGAVDGKGLSLVQWTQSDDKIILLFDLEYGLLFHASKPIGYGEISK